MGKFLLGLIIGAVVTILGILIVVLAIGRLFATKQPTIAGNSVLVLGLTGAIPETAPVDVSIPLIESAAGPTVRDLWSSLREAANDSRIKAVVLQPRNLLVGWGRLQELRQELVTFKKSGKPLYAYLEGPSSHEFYLATAADKIYLSPDDMLDVKGFRLEEMYFKGSLDKLGVGVQVDHIGQYKDAGDIFTRTNMSPDTREVLNQVLDQIYSDFCSTTGPARHKTADDMRALVDMGPFLAVQAKASGLVDELGYEDQVYADLKKKLAIDDLNKAPIKSYFRAVPGRGDHIAFLAGEGEIVRGESENTFGNAGVIASGTFAKTIRQVRDDNSIKGVIVRIDSPGGDAIASDEILHELKLLSARKPLVVSMSDLAASGGYFISMTGDPLICYPDTITGSIGVVYMRPNFHGLFDKLGIQEDTISRGKLANMDSLYAPLTDAAQQKLHDAIQATYRSFVSKVATARRKTYDQIDPLAQGRVWMGAQAHQNGLVDQLGTLDAAVSLLRSRAKLSPTGDTNLIMYPPRRNLIEVLTSSSSEAMAESLAIARLRRAVPGLPNTSILKGGLLSVLPYTLTIH